jgi:hypothetical protein
MLRQGFRTVNSVLLAGLSPTPASPDQHTLPNPFILPIIRTDQQDHIIPCSVVEVEQIRDQAEKPEASGKDDQLILAAEFGEDVLLKLL